MKDFFYTIIDYIYYILSLIISYIGRIVSTTIQFVLEQIGVSKVIIDSVPFFVKGLGISVTITICALLGGLIFGTLLALMRLSGIKALELFAAGYVNLVRSIPLIMVLLWFLLIVGAGGITSAIIAFIFFEAAYFSEIMRAGIQSVKKGQTQSGQALGLTYWQIQRFIVLPQAFRAMLPLIITQTIILFQDTSLLKIVGSAGIDFFSSITLVAEKDASQVFPLFIFAAVMYFIICFSGSMYVKHLQAGMKK